MFEENSLWKKNKHIPTTTGYKMYCNPLVEEPAPVRAVVGEIFSPKFPTFGKIGNWRQDTEEAFFCHDL